MAEINESITSALIDFLLNPWFRWLSFIALTVLTILGYIQEPIRFSDKRDILNINYKYQYFILQIINFSLAAIAFLGLWYTIPFTNKFPYLWYIPLLIMCYAYITQITIDSPTVIDDKNDLNAPPSYLWSKDYRLWIFWGILIFDAICFLQGFLYAGIMPQFNNTVLHQFVLNRFGGANPGNIVSFTYSWLGIVAIFLDIYVLYNQINYRACDYNLPASWNY